MKQYKSRVSDQNGVSLLYIMLEIHHSDRELSKCLGWLIVYVGWQSCQYGDYGSFALLVLCGWLLDQSLVSLISKVLLESVLLSVKGRAFIRKWIQV